MTNNFVPFALLIAAFMLLYVLLYGHISERASGFYFKSKEENWYTWLKSFHSSSNVDLSTTGEDYTAIKTEEHSTSGMPHLVHFNLMDQTRVEHKETIMPPLQIDKLIQYPNWDFEEVYPRDKQPRQTMCPQSVVHSEDQSFKKAFIPDIQLYLYRNQLNVKEWNRLAHFNNPFGFMGYTNYTEIKEVVDMIPEPKEPLLSQEKPGCKRCAVVAAGGILKGSKKGKEIDSHDYVFRMNGAITKGYEEDVGNRTSVYVHSAHAIIQSPRIFHKFGYKKAPHDEGIKYVLIPEGNRDFRWLHGLFRKQTVSKGEYRNTLPSSYYSGQFDEKRFYVLHPDFLRYIRNRFLDSAALKGRYWSIFRPTNGAFTLFLALHTCDVVRWYSL
ncbi:hypothetical protein DPEC_G00029890 [Dallia pectoralis]|uniref:Uncharacterized protein n=1 Tax=Dallia pectoralis TaxID=75939 RepID=A0ACC2HC76_DALPE|nr:hypothetical protein DPEC_G00029890 [Dallia pectoralis]